MNSMTGYGKGEASNDNLRLTVEIKSVNHRFLDLTFKLPRGFQSEEDVLRKVISKGVARGHLDVYVNFEKIGRSALSYDKALAATYAAMGEQLSRELGVTNDLTASTIMRMPDVVTAVAAEDEDAKTVLVKEAAEIAVKNLVSMRKTEGAALVADLVGKISTLHDLKEAIAVEAPKVKEAYFKNATRRVKELLDGAPIDEARILNETAVFADKAAIDEELVRLSGHLTHFLELLKSGNGKSLDFLVQEMGREVNTIGSKSNDYGITENVLLMKNEVEKIREQVQNLE